MDAVSLRESSPGIAIIEFNDPPANALSARVRRALSEALGELTTTGRSPRVLIVAGGRPVFCGGADIGELVEACAAGENRIRELAQSVQSLLLTLERSPFPVIAAMDGHAVGGGLELALSCDFRVAASRVKLGLPEVGLGLIPGAGGTQRLPLAIGMARAVDMVMLGNPVSAAKALEIGLVHRVAQEESALEAAISLAEELVRLPRVALAAAKRALRASSAIDLATELDAFVQAATSVDAAEGIRAFLAKEGPRFVHE